MNFARCDAIARAVLYEGYNLYPYRPSSLKNRHRWTFGSVFPPDWAARDDHDRSFVETQCLLRGGPATVLEVHARFLHIVTREIGALDEPAAQLPAGREPSLTRTPWLEVGDRLLLDWEEAQECEIVAPARPIGDIIAAPITIPFCCGAGRELEPVAGTDGRIAALIIRSARPLSGWLAVRVEPVAQEGGIYRVTARIENTTPLLAADEVMDRAAAQRSALASAHAVLGMQNGAFVSLLAPPADLKDAAESCRNQGLWPVLAGMPGETDLMLSSPIILYDYPQVAPESPGDLFDGCEIDEILSLRILTLTEAEKREMAATDPHTRALLQRTEALTADELAGLHGTFRRTFQRTFQPGEPTACRPLRVGQRVRLKPKAHGDVMDVVLRDQIAVVEAVERDFEDRVHVAVTILDDPGRDLGLARMPGHRFFFAEDELEELESLGPGGPG